MKAQKIGTLGVSGNNFDLKIRNVLYVESLRTNLLAVSKMDEAGLITVFGNGKVKIVQSREVIAERLKDSNLYNIKFKVLRSGSYACKRVNEFNKIV